MNKTRRAELRKIIKRIDALKESLKECVTDLEAVRDDEQEAFDNSPESVQGSERGASMEAAITGIEDLISEISEFAEDSTEVSDCDL